MLTILRMSLIVIAAGLIAFFLKNLNISIAIFTANQRIDIHLNLIIICVVLILLIMRYSKKITQTLFKRFKV